MSKINLPRSRFVKNPEAYMTRREVSWTEVRDQVKQVNPIFAKIIDQLNPSYPLFLQSYDYGFMIANYQNKPEVSLVLDKSCELFLDYGSKKPVYRIYGAGEIIFAERILGRSNWFYEQTLWKLNAGCRSVFMTPNITEQKGHTRLSEHYHFSIKKPLGPQDHSNIFKLIANSKIYGQDRPWKFSLLSFSDEWFLHRNDPAWAEFYRFLEHTITEHEDTTRQKALLDMILALLQREKELKISLPQSEQISHLLMLGLKGVPGFRPADENMMPVNLVTEAYLNHYGLKKYAPIIMGPDYFDLESAVGKSLYYSFHHPTSYLMSPRTNQNKSLVHDFAIAHWAFNKTRDLLLSKKFVLENSTLYRLMAECTFDFYHEEAADYREFKLPEELMQDDPALMQPWPKLTLQTYSPFLNGCVRIQKQV